MRKGGHLACFTCFLMNDDRFKKIRRNNLSRRSILHRWFAAARESVSVDERINFPNLLIAAVFSRFFTMFLLGRLRAFFVAFASLSPSAPEGAAIEAVLSAILSRQGNDLVRVTSNERRRVFIYPWPSIRTSSTRPTLTTRHDCQRSPQKNSQPRKTKRYRIGVLVEKITPTRNLFHRSIQWRSQDAIFPSRVQPFADYFGEVAWPQIFGCNEKGNVINEGKKPF